jgi:hypothetical protein
MTSRSRIKAASVGLPKLSFGSRPPIGGTFIHAELIETQSDFQEEYAKRKLEETVCRRTEGLI